MFETVASAVGLREFGTCGRIRTYTEWFLRPLPLPLGYTGLVKREGFEPPVVFKPPVLQTGADSYTASATIWRIL